MILFSKAFKLSQLHDCYTVCNGIGAIKLMERACTKVYDTPMPIYKFDQDKLFYTVLDKNKTAVTLGAEAVLRGANEVFVKPSSPMETQVGIIMKMKLPINMARINNVITNVPLTVCGVRKVSVANDLLLLYVQSPVGKTCNLSERWLKITAKQRKELLAKAAVQEEFK